MKLLLTCDFGKEKMDYIRNLEYEITCIKENQIMGKDKFNNFEVIVCNNLFKYHDFNEFENIKWIQLLSSGVDKVLFEQIKQANILLTNCKGAYSIPIAEWTITKILELYKNSRKFYELQNNKNWEKNKSIYELHNKNACILGTGSISIEIAKRLRAFNVKVTGINTTGVDLEYFDECFTLKNLKHVLSTNDIVINTLPLTEKTINLINDDFISKMKIKSVLINVSRGKILDELALIKYLNSGHLLGAALDVFELEPLPPSNPLWLSNNIIITPHVSYASDKGDQRIFDIVFENLKRYKNNLVLINNVEHSKGY